MFGITDIGNICLIGLVMFALVGLIGEAGAWPMVGALAAVVFVAVILHK